MKSIRRTLLLWLFAGLSSGIVLAGVLLYLQARGEANRLFDYQMQQVATALPTPSFASAFAQRYDAPGMQTDIVIQIWTKSGLYLYPSHRQPRLPHPTGLGFLNVSTGNGVWRVYSVLHGDAIVQVAQPLGVRRQVAADMAFKTVAPLLLLFPFLGVLIWVTVSIGLEPIKRVATDVQSRDAGALTPIPDSGLPQEIQPLTHALNDLLGRLERAIDAQRAFIANAAHELRTPLAAVQLQIQLAERATSAAERNAAFAELRGGFARATHMVQQLLTLARQEPGAASRAHEVVDLCTLLRDVLAEHALAASTKHIDAGLDCRAEPQRASVHGDPEALRTLFGNLIDNAIRYTPEGGQVDVTVQADTDTCSVTVCDNGPGIPPDDRARVFDRFYRVHGTGVPGSGLGLAIAKQIADTHGAQILLDHAEADAGLCVRVLFAHGARS